MNRWKIKYKVLEIKIIQEIWYLIYRLKTSIGIKTIGFGKFDGLVLMKLLSKYKPDIYYMHVLSIADNLDSIDLEAVHENGIRLDNADYLSIILNSNDRQVSIVVGKNLRKYINTRTELEIVNQMEEKVKIGEVIGGIELGMKRIKQCLTKSK